jgi:hypothetical protein
MQEQGCFPQGEMPALHDAANVSSLNAQRQYLRLIKLNLVALLVGAVAGAVVLPAVGRVIAGVAALALVAALLLTFVIQNKSYERTWYGGRAIAESVKTLAWRYMARAEPFDGGDDATSDELFLNRLAQTLESGANLNVNLSAVSGSDQITLRMREVRAWPLAQRRDYYDRCRIQDQQKWYSKKSGLSERAAGWFFAGMLLSNVLAVAAAVAMVIRPDLPVNGTGVFSTAAAAVFAWLQVRRHQEIAQSYAIAAQELAIVHGKVGAIATDAKFAVLVADAENAISREHTLWVARRDAGVNLSAH